MHYVRPSAVDYEDINELLFAPRKRKVDNLENFHEGDKIKIVNPAPYMSYTRGSRGEPVLKVSNPSTVYFVKEYPHHFVVHCVYPYFEFDESIAKNVLLSTDLDIEKVEE